MKKILIGFVCLTLAIAVLSLAASKPKKSSTKGGKEEFKEITWPAPPEKPVIKFSGLFLGDVNFPAPKKGRFKQKLLGEKPVKRYLMPPFDVAADSKRNRLYVSCRAFVGVFDMANKVYAEFHGEPPLALQYVTGLWVDGDGNLYAADAKSQSVMVFNPELKPLRTYLAPGKIEHPADVAVNDELGLVYVSDSKNSVIHVFSKDDAKYLKAIGSQGSEDGQFFKPSFLWVDKAGLLYVTDFLNFRVQGFDSEGDFLFKIGSIGKGAGQFSKPKGVAVDNEGHIYVADSAFSNVQIFDRTGRLLLFFGNFGLDEGEMRLPTGMWITGDGNIFVADSINSRVCMFQFLGAPEAAAGASP